MQKWEYRVVRGVARVDEAELNRMGGDGWELAGVGQAAGGGELIFKRPAGIEAALEPLEKEPDPEMPVSARR